MPFDRLLEAIAEKQNPTVVGLDPTLEYIPPFIKEGLLPQCGDPLEGAAACVLEYNRRLIEALCDVVPAVKPQAAYYEALGWPGVRALRETIRLARERGMFVILDGKRNDIGSTMAAYAKAHLGLSAVGEARVEPFGADALTVNGYLGEDGIAPLIDICMERDRGIFVLVKTSNPSSGQVQDRALDDGRTVYQLLGDLCEAWGGRCMGGYGYSAVGAVVGATYPAQLRELRARMPHTLFLVPGYGAQGGSAADVAGAFDKNGLGAVVNSSRAILTAWKKEEGEGRDFAGAARREALRMRAAIVGEIGEIRL